MRQAIHVAVVVAGACALLASSGTCSFETRSGAYQCTPEGECPDGRICVQGWCVVDGDVSDGAVGDGNLADAPPGPDAPPGIDASWIDATVDCPNGDCGPLEDPDNCPDDCSTCDSCSAGTCDESCGGDGADCNLTCAASTCSCNYDCTAANNCEIKCDDGTTCIIDCTNANNCNKVRCVGGAACRIYCTGANNCGFSQCTGGSGVVSCSDGAACNRDC